MRLTLRILAGSMAAIETALDEICNAVRAGNGNYYLALVAARKQMKIARQAVVAILDEMIDAGAD